MVAKDGWRKRRKIERDGWRSLKVERCVVKRWMPEERKIIAKTVGKWVFH